MEPARWPFGIKTIYKRWNAKRCIFFFLFRDHDQTRVYEIHMTEFSMYNGWEGRGGGETLLILVFKRNAALIKIEMAIGDRTGCVLHNRAYAWKENNFQPFSELTFRVEWKPRTFGISLKWGIYHWFSIFRAHPVHARFGCWKLVGIPST